MSQKGSYFITDGEGWKVTDFYDFCTGQLGKGSYGKVQLARLKGTDFSRAVKIIDKSKVWNVERFKIEVEIMLKLDHPNILRLLDYFEDEVSIYLVLELCSGGELFERIVSNNYFEEPEARLIFR